MISNQGIEPKVFLKFFEEKDVRFLRKCTRCLLYRYILERNKL